PGFRTAFERGSAEDRKRVLAQVRKGDAGLLYWTGAAWASAGGSAKDDMKVVGGLPNGEELGGRAAAGAEAYDEGSIHEFFIAYDGSRSAQQGGGPDRARQHMERARALSKNKKLAPLVSFAEAVDVDAQNKREFTTLLNQVIAADVDADPDH